MLIKFAAGTKIFGDAVTMQVLLWLLAFAPNTFSAVHWSMLCVEGAVLDCSDFDANRSQLAQEILSNENLLIKDRAFLGCPPIVISGGNVTFVNVTFRGSSNVDGNFKGGALQIEGGANVTLLSCHFESCASGKSGGAIFVSSSAVLAYNCTFHNCVAENGGAIQSGSESLLQLLHCLFTSCRSTAQGGAISAASGATVVASSCSFSNCTAENGGSVSSASGSRSSFIDCGFSSSYAKGDGGAIHSDGLAIVNMTGCAFEGCSASRYGGAIMLAGGSAASAFGCSFNYSSARDRGGTIHITEGSSLDCIDSECSNSHALSEGSTFYVGQTESLLTLLRCNITNSSTANEMGDAVSVNVGGELRVDFVRFHNATSVFGGQRTHTRRSYNKDSASPCARDTEVFDETTQQCVALPGELVRQRNTFMLHTLVGCLAGTVALLITVLTLQVHRRRVDRDRRNAFAFADSLLSVGTVDADSTQSIETSRMLVSEHLRRYYDRKRFEIAKVCLQVCGKVGQGEFGVVMRGLFTSRSNREIAVAIKLPLLFGASAHYEALIEELKIMASAGDHPNIVKLHGAVTESILKGELLIVMELCECSLLDFLHDKATLAFIASPPSLSLSLEIGCGIAAGMEYLASKQIVHRDLAARNILLDNLASPKISDYGLARKMKRGYYRSKNRKSPVALPWQWMALELLDFSPEDRFTSKCDVWSYGVLMWEIFTFGDEPYADSDGFKANSVSQLKEYLTSGQRLPRPEYCQKNLFALIEQCWHKDPSQRPSFAKCEAFLRDFLVKFEDLGS